MRYLILLLLAGCAAAPQDACTRECNPVFDGCAEAGASLSSRHAVDMLEEQCEIAQNACIRACKQDSFAQ